MTQAHDTKVWKAGSAPVAVVMISLNEAHNLPAVLDNLEGWAQEVFLVDSCSADQTVDIALSRGVHVVQRRFTGFGEQWNFALENLPISAPWTMKLDPDERLTNELKSSLHELVCKTPSASIFVNRRLWFMGKTLPVVQPILRLWRTGTCRFSNVAVNEHPLVEGPTCRATGFLDHHDSPDLDHWVVKQNRYTTSEAISQAKGEALSVEPRLLGSSLERRMWIKKNFWRMPGRYLILFAYHLLVDGAWRAGKVGWIWSRLRCDVYRLWEYKRFEIEKTGRLPAKIPAHPGQPDSRVPFFE